MVIETEHIDDVIAVDEWRAEAARVLSVPEDSSIRECPHCASAIDDLSPWWNTSVVRRFPIAGRWPTTRIDIAYRRPTTIPPPPLVIEAEYVDEVIAI